MKKGHFRSDLFKADYSCRPEPFTCYDSCLWYRGLSSCKRRLIVLEQSDIDGDHIPDLILNKETDN